MATIVALGVTVAACGGQKDKPPVPQSSDPLVTQGYEVALKQACFGCHKIGGKGGSSGPAFDVSSMTQLSTGTKVQADDAYLRRAITDPDEEIVQGYSKGIMSSGMSGRKLNDEQINALVAYLKSVRTNG